VWVLRTARRREDLSRRLSAGLEQRNRDLDAFAGRVAHDLRGPLTAISLAGAQLARRSPELGAGAVFDRGVKRMETLIDDLLTLARVDVAGGNATCDALGAVFAMKDDLVSRVQAKGGQLRIDVAPGTLRCTEGLLQQALINLVDNAVKYARPDVPLELEIHGHAERAAYLYSVRDNGMGMEPADARRAFEPFFRAHAALALPGTGLGLAIVRRVVEAHGGTASVDSKSGVGTTITLRFPLAVRASGA
jgi:signal transduction histidine kinase